LSPVPSEVAQRWSSSHAGHRVAHAR
jgi:hypothetical protein